MTVIVMEITLGQIQFAPSLQAIAHPQLSGAKAEGECLPALHQLIMPLLGAAVYLPHTRMDVLVITARSRGARTKPKVFGGGRAL